MMMKEIQISNGLKLTLSVKFAMKSLQVTVIAKRSHVHL